MGAPSDAGYTKALASFVASLGWDDLPPEVVSRAKLLVLDGLGCGVFGASQPWSHILVRTLETIDGANHTSGVWGRDVRLPVPHAALANATAVQGVELDDVHVPGYLALRIPHHPGRACPQRVAWVSERSRSVDGDRGWIRGWFPGRYVHAWSRDADARVAFRVNCRWLCHSIHDRKSAGTRATATEHALGIAGSGASAPMAAQYGAMVKRLQYDRVCQSGVYAGLLAEAGLTGIEDVFEIPYGGFCTPFTQRADALGALTAGLGSELETQRIRVKLYPCLAECHARVNTALLLKQREGFSTDDILRIELTGAKPFVDHGVWPYASKTVTEA
jgi:aconitate decarboxylase